MRQDKAAVPGGAGVGAGPQGAHPARGLKQFIFKPLGGFKHMLAQSSLWLSAINFVLIGATAYNTTLAPYINNVLPWFHMWHFMVLLVAGIAFIMMLEYKLIYPSWIAFQNQQEYEHQNLLRVDIAALAKEVGELRDALKLKGAGGEDTATTP